VPDYPYQTGELTLEPGDSRMESPRAMDGDHALFGNARLLDACLQDRHRAAKIMAEGLFQAVRAYAGDAPQSDDITVVAMRYLGRRVPSVGLDALAGSGI
jgi:phosphoserine phosphatase RsbU/P